MATRSAQSHAARAHALLVLLALLHAVPAAAQRSGAVALAAGQLFEYGFSSTSTVVGGEAVLTQATVRVTVMHVGSDVATCRLDVLRVLQRAQRAFADHAYLLDTPQMAFGHPFFFTVAPEGHILHVHHAPDEAPYVLVFKKACAGMLSARLQLPEV